MIRKLQRGKDRGAAVFTRWMVENTSMKLPKTLKPAQAAIGVGLLVLIGGLGWWLGAGAAVQSAPPRLIAVATGKAAIKDLPYRVEAPGLIASSSMYLQAVRLPQICRASPGGAPTAAVRQTPA